MSSKLPATIRKIIATKPSNKFRDVVKITTVPTPQPGEGEVLVKNKYVGINASDINYSAGRYDPSAKFPIDCGFEAVGEVVSSGPKTAYKPGQAVMYCQYGAFSDFKAMGEVVAIGPKCDLKVGQTVMYLAYGSFADYKGMGEVVAVGPGCDLKVGQTVMYIAKGSFADYKLIKANTAIPLPDLKAEYLPFILSGNTAAISLDKVGELKKGETVLVTAAAGGTGQIAVQWAKLAGCHVIGTCSTEDKVQFLKDIGCDRPINYKKEKIGDVLKAEYPKGLDVVYETIGGEVFDTCVENLAVMGRLIIIGYITNYESDKGFIPSKTLATLPARLLPKSASVRGFFLNNFTADWGPYVMKQLKYMKEGKLKTFVDKGSKSAAGPFIGLEKVVDAVDYLYSQKSIGKIIVELDAKL